MSEAKIEKDAIVIRIPVKDVPQLVEGAWASNAMDTRYRVTNAAVFAKELVTRINDEDGEGTTAIHRLFDAAIEEALEQGAEGIEEHEDQQI